MKCERIQKRSCASNNITSAHLRCEAHRPSRQMWKFRTFLKFYSVMNLHLIILLLFLCFILLWFFILLWLYFRYFTFFLYSFQSDMFLSLSLFYWSLKRDITAPRCWGEIKSDQRLHLKYLAETARSSLRQQQILMLRFSISEVKILIAASVLSCFCSRPFSATRVIYLTEVSKWCKFIVNGCI